MPTKTVVKKSSGKVIVIDGKEYIVGEKMIKKTKVKSVKKSKARKSVRKTRKSVRKTRKSVHLG